MGTQKKLNLKNQAIQLMGGRISLQKVSTSAFQCEAGFCTHGVFDIIHGTPADVAKACLKADQKCRAYDYSTDEGYGHLCILEKFANLEDCSDGSGELDPSTPDCHSFQICFKNQVDICFDCIGFEEFIVDVKETCDDKFKIGESTFNEGEDTCRERCRSDADCNYYFYTFKDYCNDKEWCVLYKDCSKTRIPGCNGRTFTKTVTPVS